MNGLYKMLRSMRQGQLLELLTLTACETAVGSDREALGIAGISLQAGARSTVASLWQVDDQATAQMITHLLPVAEAGYESCQSTANCTKNLAPAASRRSSPSRLLGSIDSRWQLALNGSQRSAVSGQRSDGQRSAVSMKL